MPAPLAHAAIGYILYRVSRKRMPEEARRRIGPVPTLLASAVVLSLVPDLDAVPGVLFSDIGRFHNNLSHSILAGLIFASGVGILVLGSGYRRALKWAMLALVCFQFHLLMDLFTYESRGLLLLWPFSEERFQVPISLFYGFHWSEGILSLKHLITVSTETVLAIFVLMLVKLGDRLKIGNRTDN